MGLQEDLDSYPKQSGKRKKIKIIIRGLTVRTFFAIHVVLCTWLLVIMKDHKENYKYYWFLLLIQLFVVCEAVMTLKLRINDNGEWEWFSPCIFLYVMSVIPCIWLLELELLHMRLKHVKHSDSSMAIGDVSCGFQMNNQTESVFGLDIGIRIESSVLNDWRSSVLQHSFLILLIVGRWWLPRGALRHQELSNLLLVHIGMAADILEFITDSLETDEIKCDRTLVIVVLTFWSWSLMQFPFHCFSKVVEDIVVKEENNRLRKTAWFTRCIKNPDVWCSICTCAMQDGPFLCVRIYFISCYGFSHHAQLFFIAKNMLVLMLQVYRLWALLLKWEDKKGKVVQRKLRTIRGTLRRRLTRNSSRTPSVNPVLDGNNINHNSLERDTNKSKGACRVMYGNTMDKPSLFLQIPGITIE